MDWFKADMVPGQGIIVHTKQPRSIPGSHRLLHSHALQLGRRVARSCTRWLLWMNCPTFSRSDGVPYTFDTDQIMRGLCAALGDVDGAEAALHEAGRMLTQVAPNGQLLTPSTEQWTDIASDLIHTYHAAPAGADQATAGREGIRGGCVLRAGLLQAAEGAGAIQPPVAFPCLWRRCARWASWSWRARRHGRRRTRATQGRCRAGLPRRGMGVFHRRGATPSSVRTLGERERADRAVTTSKRSRTPRADSMAATVRAPSTSRAPRSAGA